MVVVVVWGTAPLPLMRRVPVALALAPLPQVVVVASKCSPLQQWVPVVALGPATVPLVRLVVAVVPSACSLLFPQVTVVVVVVARLL